MTLTLMVYLLNIIITGFFLFRTQKNFTLIFFCYTKKLTHKNHYYKEVHRVHYSLVTLHSKNCLHTKVSESRHKSRHKLRHKSRHKLLHKSRHKSRHKTYDKLRHKSLGTLSLFNAVVLVR